MNKPTDLEHEYALLLNDIYNMMPKSWQIDFGKDPAIAQYVKLLLKKTEVLNEQTKQR